MLNWTLILETWGGRRAIRTTRIWQDTGKSADFYSQALEELKELKNKIKTQPQYVKSSQMPWEYTPQGKIKHLLNEHLDTRARCVDIYLQEIPPGGRSGKHRHMADEYVFVTGGRGHDIHWDMSIVLKDKYYWVPQKEGAEYEWVEGDIVYIPINTIHQHFNADAKKPAYIISMQNRIFKSMGYDYLSRLEDAPDYLP